ncbi:MAG: hypothetical protein K9G49_02710 [Taibaiella sp.]|nr:hypothetical protein [Taibaiella sp.]
MAAFFFQLELPVINDSIVATIPTHRLYINKLFAEGRILSYSVSANRSMVWCVINAEEEQEALEMVLSFPLYPHFTDVICHPLLFHNTLPTAMPGISLN